MNPVGIVETAFDRLTAAARTSSCIYPAALLTLIARCFIRAFRTVTIFTFTWPEYAASRTDCETVSFRCMSAAPRCGSVRQRPVWPRWSFRPGRLMVRSACSTPASGFKKSPVWCLWRPFCCWRRWRSSAAAAAGFGRQNAGRVAFEVSFPGGRRESSTGRRTAKAAALSGKHCGAR